MLYRNKNKSKHNLFQQAALKEAKTNEPKSQIEKTGKTKIIENNL